MMYYKRYGVGGHNIYMKGHDGSSVTRRNETVGKGVDNVPSGQHGIDQDLVMDARFVDLEARMALIWGNKLYRNGVLVITLLTPTLPLACKYSSIKNKFRINRGEGGGFFFSLGMCQRDERGPEMLMPSTVIVG